MKEPILRPVAAPFITLKPVKYNVRICEFAQSKYRYY